MKMMQQFFFFDSPFFVFCSSNYDSATPGLHQLVYIYIYIYIYIFIFIYIGMGSDFLVTELKAESRA